MILIAAAVELAGLAYLPSLRLLLAVYLVFTVGLLAALAKQVWVRASQARSFGKELDAASGTRVASDCLSGTQPGHAR